MTIHEMRSAIERACELLNLPRIEYYRWIRAEYLSKITQEDKIILEKTEERVHSSRMGASGVEDCRNINGRKVGEKRNEWMNRSRSPILRDIFNIK